MKWLDSLNDEAQARVTTALDRLEQGNLSSVKSVGTGVQELRVRFGPGYRIYFGWHGEEVVILLGGGSKKRQAADIQRGPKVSGKNSKPAARRTHGTDDKFQ